MAGGTIVGNGLVDPVQMAFIAFNIAMPHGEREYRMIKTGLIPDKTGNKMTFVALC